MSVSHRHVPDLVCAELIAPGRQIGKEESAAVVGGNFPRSAELRRRNPHDGASYGLARSIGVSNFHEKHLRRLIAESDVVPAVNQIEVHPTLAQFDLIAVNDELGIATEAWSPLGRKADLDNEVIVRIAERQGKSPAQVILRWHVQRGNIVFPKSQNPDRLKQNFDIFDFELSDDDVLAIDGIGGENRVGPDPETFNRH